LNGELISADSRQVYRGMDIGTGKDFDGAQTIPNLAQSVQYNSVSYQLIPYELQGIPLWMYDVVNPNELFSVAQYQHLADHIIEDVLKRGHTPIIVGGSGLYIQSLLTTIDTASIPQDMVLRGRLDKLSVSDLQEMVKKEGVTIWNTMNDSDRHNPRRLIRKVEILRTKQATPFTPNKTKRDFYIVGLTAPKEFLDAKIDSRVDKRMTQGLLDEIRCLIEKGYGWQNTSFDALGYRQWRIYFEEQKNGNQMDEKPIIEKWKQEEHAYARRQMTWFKRNADIHWFDISLKESLTSAEEKIHAWYNKLI
jgi:tRNA dimethylallyltransferase